MEMKKREPTGLRRRRNLQKLVLASAGIATASLSGLARATPKFSLTMATSWPTSLPLLHTAALDFATTVRELSSGSIVIDVIDPSVHGSPDKVLDMVVDGEYDFGHTTAQYYAKKIPPIDFFTTVPFGLSPIEQHSWMNEGGGKQLLDAVLKPFGIEGWVAANTGMQMGGWFTREIRTVDDFKGLRIRINGFPGRVLARLGATPSSQPFSRLASAFASREIDAADIVGPAIDHAIGAEKYARFYYRPWHEFDVAMHLFCNSKRLNTLPTGTRALIQHAAAATAMRSNARAQYYNAAAMEELSRNGVEVRSFAPDVIAALKQGTAAELAASSEANSQSKMVIESWRATAMALGKYASLCEAPALSYRNTSA